MTDIYEYKANKYKLKYLKLKRELYGGHSLYCEPIGNIVSVRDLKKLDIKQIFCDNYDPKIDFNLILEKGMFNFSSYNFICYFFNKQTIILKKI